MDNKRRLLKHFLAGLAYRTQKALRGAPREFASFRAAPKARTPHEIIRHMDSVLGYARTYFIGGSYRPPEFPDFSDAVSHFHEVLGDIARHLEQGTEFQGITEEKLLHGPLSDAMTHAGQLGILRRLAGNPVPPEDFIYANISPDNLGPEQPLPARPDREWPEAPDRNDPSAKDENTETGDSSHHVLYELEVRLMQPEVRRSPAELEKLLADEFVEFAGSGQVFDKRAIIESLGKEKEIQISISDFQQVPLGPDTALVTYRAVVSGHEGQPDTHSLRSSIWKRTDEMWRMVFHQGTPTSP